MKRDQDSSKDGELFFLEKFKKNVKKYATPGGGLQCDPSQWG